MKSIRCLFAFALVVIGSTCTAVAGETIGAFTWNYSQPVSDTNEFTDNDSWLGAGLEGRTALGLGNTSIGVLFGWNEFHDTSDRLIELPSGAISGGQYRNLNIYPMLVTGHYYFGEYGTPRPYIGLGAGMYYVRQLLDIGFNALEAQDWHFGLAPEFGVLIPAGRGNEAGTIISLRYHYPFEGGEYWGGEKSYSYVTFGVGFCWSDY
jgi:hypothetical protein